MLALASAVLVLGLPAPAAAQPQQAPHACGPLKNAYGPYDYRYHRAELQVVEAFHFGPLSEALIKPMDHQIFGGDFDYTLRASPNHHRALMSMSKLSERMKVPQPPGATYTVDCYFDRAMRFAPDDMIVRMIYAGHLGRTNRVAEASKQLDYVSTKAADNPFTRYNLGLSYFDIKQYDKALVQAHEAARLGLPRTELRDALKAAGKWTDAAAPTPAAPAGAAPVAAAPASAASQP